jgi:chemotaxis regulatin CheY-phosphate phosphatase CheZ
MATEKKQDQTTDEELAAYEKMRQRVSKTFGELHGKINGKTISQAIDKATTELKEAGGHSMEAIGKASAALKKDIVSTTEHLKPKVDEVAEEAKKQFDHWLDKGGALWHDIAQEAEHVYEFSRDKGGAFLVNVTRGLSEWGRAMGEKLDTSLKYKTGEISHGGEFICTNCDGKIHLKHPGRIPPCPKCTKTEFRRS